MDNLHLSLVLFLPLIFLTDRSVLNKRYKWLLILVLGLTGCAPPESAIQTEISATQTAFPVSTSIPTSTPYPEEILDLHGVWMRLVPSGDFMMGSDSSSFNDESPTHSIYLDAYYIDKYEVANVFYKVCADAGVCSPPKNTGSSKHSSYYGNPEFNTYPVVHVDFNMAKTYCEWRGTKLPTEAQWEKAARGTDERKYPWGEEIKRSFANYDSVAGDTTAVISYETGISPYGVYNMAGNVSEWVEDWYSETFYLDSPSSNPLGAETGGYRIQRGGSWNNMDVFLRTTYRIKTFPTYVHHDVGFRCVMNLLP